MAGGRRDRHRRVPPAPISTRGRRYDDRTQAPGRTGLVLTETPEEIEYELRAAEGSMWTGSRLLIGAVSFAFASLAFAYFYLRSSNSEDLWRPHGVTAPTGIGQRPSSP